MKTLGLVGYQRGSWKGCTKRDRSQLRSPDLVKRDFTATAPNEVWVSDVTELATTDGKRFVCAVTDLFSRRVIAVAMSDRNDSDLTTKTLTAGFNTRRLTNQSHRVVFHADQGSNYTSTEMKLCARNLNIIDLSNGSTGDCYDNSAAESLFGTLKEEWYHHTRVTDAETTFAGVRNFLCWYNTDRRHSYNENQSPLMAELLHHVGQAT